MVITIPMPNDDGDVVGAIVGQINSEVFNNILLSQTTVGTTSETYLVDHSDQMLVSPVRSTDFPLASDLSSPGITAALRKTTTDSVYDNYAGVRVIGISQQIPQLDVVILAEIQEGEAIGVLNNIRDFTLLVAVIAAVIAVASGFYATNRIVQPIRKLTDVASAVTAGDYEQVVSINLNNEIGQLAFSFNTMTTRLRELINTLEQQVNDRTRDLQLAPHVSKQVTTVLDFSDLLSQLVTLTQDNFNLSSVSVFLYDPETLTLELEAATGKSGIKMLEAGKSFKVDDQGLVPQATLNREPLLVNDVTRDARYFDNPFLPDTKSELVIPMITGDRLIGVIDC